MIQLKLEILDWLKGIAVDDLKFNPQLEHLYICPYSYLNQSRIVLSAIFGLLAVFFIKCFTDNLLGLQKQNMHWLKKYKTNNTS